MSAKRTFFKTPITTTPPLPPFENSFRNTLLYGQGRVGEGVVPPPLYFF